MIDIAMYTKRTSPKQLIKKYLTSPNIKNSVEQNAINIGALLSTSRILGVIRDSLISRFVDLNIHDMYTLAVKIPSTIRRLSAEGVLDSAYVPSLSKFTPTEEYEGSMWLRNMSHLIMTYVLIVVQSCIAFLPYWIPFFLPNQDPESIQIFKDLFILFLPMTIFYILSATYIAVLQKHEIFIHSHLGQPVANICMILALIIGYNITNSYYVLGICNTAGAIGHFIWQYYGVRHLSRAKLKNSLLDSAASNTILLCLVLCVILGITYITNIWFNSPIIDSIRFWIISILITSILLLSILVFMMRKQKDDNTLEYGSIISTNYAKIGLINYTTTIVFSVTFGLLIIQNLSLLASWQDLINNIMMACILAILYQNILQSIKNKVWSRSKLFQIQVYAYLGLGLGLIIAHLLFKDVKYLYISCIHAFTLITLIYSAMALYKANFDSQIISAKFNTINKNFMQICVNAFLGNGIIQIMSLVQIFVCARLGAGAPSYMNRADKIIQFPLALLGVSFGTALLPRLSEFIANNNLVDAQKTYNKAIQINLGLSLGVIALLMLTSIPEFIMQIIYMGGKTNYHDIVIIANLFKIQLLALPASVICKTLSPIYFAADQSDIVRKSAIIQAIIDISLKIFILYMRLDMYAMAWSWILGSWINALFLLFNSTKYIDPFGPVRQILRFKY